jgi:hypothetical protein
MRYAPPNAAGVIHIEVKAVVKDALAAIAKEPEFKDIDPNNLESIGNFCGKIDALDVFFESGESGFQLPLMVFYGRLTAADFNKVFRDAGSEQDVFEKHEERKGHYVTGNDKLPFELVIGGESPQLPQGVAIVGADNQAQVLSEALAKLGKGKNEDLAKLLAGVDAAAPVWGGVLVDKVAPAEDLPRTIAASVYLLGGGKSKLEMVYSDANAVAAMMKEFQDPNSGESWFTFLRGLGEPSLDGATMRFVAKDTEAVLPRLVTALGDLRRGNKKDVSKAYLRHIGGTIAVYSADHDDKLPADLLELVKAGAIPAEMLVSPVTGRKVNMDANGVVAASFEPDYVLVKYPMSLLKIRNRASMVLVYERPEDYKKAGTVVLYVDEHVAWVSMEEFTKQLKATQDWIATAAKETTTKEK